MPENLMGAAGLSLWCVFSLYSANLLHWYTGNFVWSRKLAHSLVGLGIIATPLVFTSMWWPALVAGLALLVLTVRHTSLTFHGVAVLGRWSEVWFAFSVAVCFLSGVFIDPWIGVACALSLAWGDGITGLVRWLYLRRHAKGNLGSLACFATCLLICGWLVQPLWVAVIGAIAGTTAERFCGDVGWKYLRWLDDNLAMPLVMLVLFVAVKFTVLG